MNRNEIRSLPAPEPPEDLLSRIVASRAGGVRVALPTDAPSRSLPPLRYVAATVALVGGLVWVLFTGRPRATSRGGGPPAWLLDGTPLTPSVMLAQEGGLADVQPRYPLVTLFEPGRVQAGRWTYQLRWITDGVFTSSKGQASFEFVVGSYGGHPAWVMTEGRGDTAFVDLKTLRPLRYIRPMHRSLLTQDFSRDSVKELLYIASPTERRFAGAAALPGDSTSPLLISLTSYRLNALVQALPLKAGWRGSVYSVNWVSMKDRMPVFTPLDFRVTSAERITVPAGTFDCWKLDVRSGNEKASVWVSKDRGWAVMKRTVWHESGELVSEALLAAVDTTPPAP